MTLIPVLGRSWDLSNKHRASAGLIDQGLGGGEKKQCKLGVGA
jgi:hypothetical protein